MNNGVASLNSAVSNSVNNAVNAVNDSVTGLKNAAVEGWNSTTNSVSTTVGGGINSYAQYSSDVLGINAPALGEVTSSIQAYVTKVDDVIAGIEKAAGEVKYDEALKGDTQTQALDQYIKGAIETIKTVTSSINKFGEALGTVQQNYLTEEGVVAGNMEGISQQDITAKTGVSGFDG